MAACAPSRRIARALLLLLVLAIAGVALALAVNGNGAAEGGSHGPRDAGNGKPGGEVGLFTSLPILWNESDDIAGFLNEGASSHWARGAIAAHGPIRPLDRLADDKGRLPLPPRSLLVMAQPRPLAPDENLALDTWVREGGRLILLADPILTEHSEYALGDARRPQDVVLLSPILRHWGLDLQFEEDQPAGEREITVMGANFPVNLPGRFALAGAGNACDLLARGIAADCSIGEGRVIALADAALMAPAAGEAAATRVLALDALFAAATR